MSRVIVRRGAPGRRSLLGPALVGLGLGALAGFVLGELYGPAALRAVATPRRGRGPSMAELVHDAQAALAGDDLLAPLGLEILPVSRQTVELHGWVPSRRLRTRAHRVVREAVGADAVVNCLLVRGEDDAAPPTLDILTA
jgi:hypothetical protein